MRRVCFSAMITAVVAGPAVSSRAAAVEPQYTVRMATLAPGESHWGDFAQKVKDYIESRSRGRVKVIWYTSGVMGDEPETVRKIRSGEIDGGVLTINGLGAVQPALQVLMLPFLLRTYGEVDYVLDSMFPEFSRLVAEEGFVLIGFTEIGFGRLFSADPIRSVEDFARLQMWSWEGNELLGIFFQGLGVTRLVQLQLQETKAAMARGEADAFLNTCYVQPFLEWYRHTRYISNFRMGYSPGGVVIGKGFFSQLPSDLQYIVRQAFEFTMKPLRSIIRAEEKIACQGLLKRGITEYSTPPEVIGEFEQVMSTLYLKYADVYYPRGLIEEIISRLQRYRSR